MECNEKDDEAEPLLAQISNRTTFTNTSYQILLNETLHQFYTQYPKLHKNILKYNCIKKDRRSITGNNLRNIMLQQNVNSIESITLIAIMDMKYHKAGNSEEESRINMVEEMIKVKRGKLQLEIDQLLDCLCTTILYLYVNLV